MRARPPDHPRIPLTRALHVSTRAVPIPTTAVKLSGKAPAVDAAAFVAPSATLVGAVTMRESASAWYSATLKGDAAAVEIGELSTVGDRAVVTSSTVGKRALVGAGAILTSAKVGDDCSVGMGAKVLSGASLGNGSVLEAGSVLRAGTAVPAGERWAGNPAAKVGDVGGDEVEGIGRTAEVTAELAKIHADEAWKEYWLVDQEHDDYKREKGRTADEISYMRHDPKWVPLPTLGEHLTKIGVHSNNYTPP